MSVLAVVLGLHLGALALMGLMHPSAKPETSSGLTQKATPRIQYAQVAQPATPAPAQGRLPEQNAASSRYSRRGESALIAAPQPSAKPAGSLAPFGERAQARRTVPRATTEDVPDTSHSPRTEPIASGSVPVGTSPVSAAGSAAADAKGIGAEAPTDAIKAVNAASSCPTPNVRAAHALNKPPHYPPLSRQLGEEGDVLVRVWVEASGFAKDGRVIGSSGHARLDQAALLAALSWRYAHADCYGIPTSGWLQVPIRFRLGD